MKRLLFIFIFLPSLLLAQRQFHAGIAAGISATQYDGDTYSGYDKLGLNGGGFVNTSIGEKWDLQFEILYFQKGAKKLPHFDKGDYSEYLLKLDYIEVPILLRWNLSDKFTAEGGLGIGRLIRQYEEENYVPKPVSSMNAPFTNTEFSYDLGVGYKIIPNLSFNWRFTYSLFTMRGERPKWLGIYSYFAGEFNNCMAFTLRYSFGAKQNDQQPQQ